MSAEATVFEQIGGLDGCRRLTTAFYRRVVDDPVLRPLYPRSLHCAAEGLAQFLVLLFGGESDMLDRHGVVPMRHIHERFRIGQMERDAWMRHMDAALDEMALAEPLHSQVGRYFAEAATQLMNQPEAGSGSAGQPTRAYGAYPVSADACSLEQSWARIWTAESLFSAVIMGDMERARPLIDDGLAPLDKLLQQAAWSGQMEMMNFLLEQGADARTVTVDAGLLMDRPEAANLLLSHAATVNGAPGKRPPLIEATRGDKGENPERVRLLLDRGADINATSPNGRTAIHYAARAGFLHVIELLLERGAELDTPDAKGETPLLGAVTFGKRDAAARLLTAGANPNAKLHKSNRTALDLAAKRGDAEMTTLLLEHGAEPRALDKL